jgi:hypothetical protein
MIPDPIQKYIETDEIYMDHVIIAGDIRILSKPVHFSVLKNVKYGTVSLFNDESGISVSTGSARESVEWARELLGEFVGRTGAYL